jgi:hypothetical protein
MKDINDNDDDCDEKSGTDRTRVERVFPTVLEGEQRAISLREFEEDAREVELELSETIEKALLCRRRRRKESVRTNEHAREEEVIERIREAVKFEKTIGDDDDREEYVYPLSMEEDFSTQNRKGSKDGVQTTVSIVKQLKVMRPRVRRECDLKDVDSIRRPKFVALKREGDVEDILATKKKKKNDGGDGDFLRNKSSSRNSSLLLHVEVYDYHNNGKDQKLNCEVLVHADNFLSQLKDEIDCVQDYKKAGKNAVAYREAQLANESGFFFIESVFYDDMRSANAVSYSEDIIEISKTQKIPCPGMKEEEEEIGAASKGSNFTSKIMHETTFNDLRIVLGKPYLYRHQGSCDHIVQFRDIRKAHVVKRIAENSDNYPIVISERKKYKKTCLCCCIHDATVVAYKDEMADRSPFFWCDSCFDLAHPTQEEKDDTKSELYFFE